MKGSGFAALCFSCSKMLASSLLETAVSDSTPTVSYAFFPDAGRARQFDHRMRIQLADSLDYLRETLAAQWQENLQGLVALIESMRAGAVYPPSTFGLYYEVSNALMAGERRQAMGLFDELCAERPLQAGATAILTLDELRPPAAAARYLRLMDTDPAQPFRIKSPPPACTEAFRQRLSNAQSRARLLLPSLAAEISQLIRQIVLVVPEKGGEALFAGGSCYMLWGALLLNVDAFDDDILLLQALAHESAHTLLFGFASDEPLVLNDADELYASPLREDPRPMDGIFHATYVSARMHWAMATALESGKLDRQESATATTACEDNCRSFFAGHDIVKQHGQLTRAGREILARAYDYMNGVRSTSHYANSSGAPA
jgi:hypothetical protein